MEPNGLRVEKIFVCKCQYPLTNSSLTEKFYEIYHDNVLKHLEGNGKIDLNIHKFMFAVSPDIEDFNYNFELDIKNSKIVCGNCKKPVGFIIEDNMDLLDTRTLLGFLELKKIDIKEITMKNRKKEIPVISQAEYIVLAKLKQLRYYVKQLTPTLKKSMGAISEERQNIDECNNKMEKYKLNLVFNKIDKIEKEKEKKEEKDE